MMIKILEVQHAVNDVKHMQSRVIEYDGGFDEYYEDLYLGNAGIREVDTPLTNIFRFSIPNEVICNFTFTYSPQTEFEPIEMVHYAREI